MELDFDQIYQITGTRLPPADARFLYEKAMEIRPKIILEIGAAGGGSSIVLGTAARECDGHLWSIDPRPEGRWGPNIRKYNLEKFVTLINDYSPWAGAGFLPGKIDYLLIDGDHRFTNCIVDMLFYSHYLRVGGFMAVHDINTPNWRGFCIKDWINKAVEMFLRDYPVFETVTGGQKNKGGVLLMTKKSSLSKCGTLKEHYG